MSIKGDVRNDLLSTILELINSLNHTQSEMENIETVRDCANALENSVDELKDKLQPILGKKLDDLMRDCHSPKEEVSFLNSYAYCLVSVLFAAMKASGIKTENHPIMKELDRIKASMMRLKDYEQGGQKKAEAAAASQEKSKEYLQRTLGTSSSAATPDSLKKPAISQMNFQGTHTKFSDNDDDETKKSHKLQNETKTTPKNTYDSKKKSKKSNSAGKLDNGLLETKNKVNKPKKNQKSKQKKNS